MSEPTHKILLFYKYVQIDDPAQLKSDQIFLCSKLDLKGRIIVSHEGINATLEGATKNVEQYIEKMRSDHRFSDIDFKISDGDGQSFPRLSVKNRPEIVTLGTGTIHSDFQRGKYISPEEFQGWFDENKDFVVIDMRNDFEHSVGHFENSLLLPVRNFREIPNEVEKLEEFKDKTIVSVCTGGVRCEKATNYLLEKGFKNVHQLEGGMVRYLEKFPGKKFKGSLYVFDKRVTVNYDGPENHVVVGKCRHCSAPSERCVNCDYPECHGHFICCDDCGKRGIFCSQKCELLVKQAVVV